MDYEWPVNTIISTGDYVRSQFAQPNTTQIWASKEVDTHVSGYPTIMHVRDTEEEYLLAM